MAKAFEIIPVVPEFNINDPSKLTCYLTCPRMYFYQYVLGWRPGEVSNHLIFGSAWHKAMEIIIEHGYDPKYIQIAHEELVREYRKTFDPETDFMYHPKTPEIALIMLAKYCQRYAADHIRYKVEYIEIAGKINISEEHALHFRMDSIYRDLNSNEVFSLEHKTGSSTYMWSEHWPLSMQIGCYTHVLNSMYPPDEVKGVVMNGSFFKKSKKGWEQVLAGEKLTVKEPYECLRFEATRNRDQRNNWLAHANHHMDMIKWNMDALSECTDDDPVMQAFHCNPKNCSQYGRICEYYDFCDNWSNPLRRCGEPPMGWRIEHWDPSAEEAQTQITITDEATDIVVKEQDDE